MWTGFYKTLMLRWTQWLTPTEAHVYLTHFIFIAMQREILFIAKHLLQTCYVLFISLALLSLVSRLFSLVKYLELKLSC